MPTLKQLETALINADRAGDEEAARALAAEIKRVRASGAKPKAAPKKPAAKPRQRGTGVSAIDTTLDVINEALLGGVEGAYNLGAMLTDPIAGLIVGEDVMAAERARRRNFFGDVSRTFATQERPIAREIGRTLAPAAGVSRAATLAAPVVRTVVTRAGAPRAAQSLERITRAAGTGGIGSGRTAAQTAATPRLQRLGQLGERMVGGGAGAAATAALSGQPVEESAAFGAGLPIVGSVLKRVAGFAGDITKLPRQKAAEIIRKSLGANLEEARAAFAALPPDDRRLAEQVLLDSGIEPDTFYGLGGIAQRELQTPGANPMREALEQQAAVREARLAEAAGGLTAEEVRAATREGRKAVTEAMRPTREAMYQRSGIASQVVPVAERRAQDLAAEAAEQSALARRMAFGAERAETRLGQLDDLGDAFDPSAVARERGIAGAMSERAEQAAAGAIGARAGAEEMYDLVDALAAQGMRPMRAADLIGSLRALERDPMIVAGSLEERTIKNVIRQIQKATDANGMLIPEALGKIRRSGINDVVNRLSTQMGGVPSRGGTPEAAQDTVLRMRKMIDDTLRQGGAGDLVDEFIQGSERGYAAVNRQQLAGEALRLYQEEPKVASEFQALVGGQRPRVVGKIMGGGPENEQLAVALADDPARLGALRESAREMQILNRMQELRASGASPAANLMIRERPSVLARGLAAATLSPFPSVRIGATGAEQVERAVMAPRVQREIARAFTSGPAMRDIINAFPGAARISEQISRLPASVRNAFAQALIQQSVGPVAPQSLPEIDVPGADRPFSNIDYDEYGNYIGPR
ncbi:hypothetical protein UFOVP406_9 [uncultured Caudovirales phage]|uniref:Uncharacterized protein n=1 Tax=uncultured Caudovirales phage TaxID=2100421 RepID=A0A6J5M598_9CAUD|nr:hypothetical protein UFOVP406_9 [uncultured Caudovirales phage]